jgi:Fe2+ transport system protein B
VTNSQDRLVVNGKIKVVNNPSVTTNQVANPKQSVVSTNNEKIKQIVLQEMDLNKKRLTVEEDTRKECQANVGFLEELEAMVSIVTTRKVAGAFYLIFFMLLMSLELFVVTSKMGDQECDYEMAIKGAEKVKMAQFNMAFNRVQAK